MKSLVLTLFLASLCFAQTTQTAAAVSDEFQSVFSNQVGYSTGPWLNVLATNIKPSSNNGDLIVTFSAQTILAVFSTQQGEQDYTTEGGAGIQVRLLVNGKPVPVVPSAPNTEATLDNLLRRGFRQTIVPSTHAEVVSLLLNSGGNRVMRWVVPRAGNGEQNVLVQARFNLAITQLSSGTIGDTSALAVIGPKTLTVEAVNLKSR